MISVQPTWHPSVDAPPHGQNRWRLSHHFSGQGPSKPVLRMEGNVGPPWFHDSHSLARLRFPSVPSRTAPRNRWDSSCSMKINEKWRHGIEFILNIYIYIEIDGNTWYWTQNLRGSQRYILHLCRDRDVASGPWCQVLLLPVSTCIPFPVRHEGFQHIVPETAVASHQRPHIWMSWQLSGSHQVPHSSMISSLAAFRARSFTSISASLGMRCRSKCWSTCQ